MAGEGDGIQREEEVLWQLAAIAGEQDGGDDLNPASGTAVSSSASWSDDDLVAYRRGELGSEANERIEWLLANEPQARHRLFELAGIETAPPAAVRERVLEALGREQERGRVVDLESRRVASQWPRRRTRWLVPTLAAAALALVVLGPWGPLERSERVELPTGIAFELRVEGVSEVRSSERVAEESDITASGDQRLRLVIEAVESAVAGLDYGLYVSRAGAWARLEPAAGIEIEVGRGTAVFEASAATLVGQQPGRHGVLLAVAPDGQLPTSFEVPTGSDPARVLAERSRGWVRRQTIHLVSTDEGDPGDRGD